MRRRIASALALGALAGLGGCATQTRRAEVPSQFRDWKDTTAPASASTSTSTTAAGHGAPGDPFARHPGPIASLFARAKAGPARSAAMPARPGPIASILAKSMKGTPASPSSTPAPAASTTTGDATTSTTGAASTTAASRSTASTTDIPATALRPRSRSGSWLFRRPGKSLAPSSGPAAAGDPAGALARYFPTNFGKGTVDAGRLARASRPMMGGATAGRGLGLSGSSIEMTRSTVASSPPSEVEPPLLADGIPVRAHPRTTSPSTPEPGPGPESVAGRDDRPATPSGERLTSHEERPEPAPGPAPEPGPARKPDLIDALSIGVDEPPASAPRPRPRPTRFVPDAPSDPAGRPTSAMIEVPAPKDEKPAGVLVASADAAARPIADGLVPPLFGLDLASALLAAPARPQSPAGSRAEATPGPSRRDVASPTPTAARRRARALQVDAADLPPPEFPATYYSESLRRVAREAPAGPGRTPSIEAAPRRPLMVSLSGLLLGRDEAKAQADRP